MKSKKVNRGFMVKEDTLKYIQEHYMEANAKSINDFVNMALEFYIGYMKTDSAEFYLMNSISSVLQSSIEASEKRINRYLYKMAIEQAIMNRIIGLEDGVSEEEFDRLLEVAEGEVKRI